MLFLVVPEAVRALPQLFVFSKKFGRAMMLMFHHEMVQVGRMKTALVRPRFFSCSLQAFYIYALLPILERVTSGAAYQVNDFIHTPVGALQNNPYYIFFVEL